MAGGVGRRNHAAEPTRAQHDRVGDSGRGFLDL
jgi:hypothetical protein